MALSFDAASGRSTATNTSLSFSHTCSGTNRLLVVAVLTASSSEVISGVTYNSVAMTQAKKQQNSAGGGSWLYLYTLVAPATGAHNIVVSTDSSVSIAASGTSYNGARQTSQPDASNSLSETASGSRTVSVTTVSSGDWLVATHTSDNFQPTSLVSATNRFGSINDAQIIDSNASVGGAGAHTIGYNWGSSDAHAIVAIAIAPDSVPGGAALLAFVG